MVSIEKELSTPTVAFVAKGFQHDFESGVRAYGMPSVPMARVPHEFTSSSDAQVTEQIDQVIENIIQALTSCPQEKHEEAIRPISTPRPPEKSTMIPPVLDRTIPFTGATYPDAVDRFQQRFLEWGWSDGFPLIPPIREKVEWMLSGTRHAPEEVVTRLDPEKGIATVEKIAINAVMAGAIPTYFPIILAAVEAMMAPQFEIMKCVMSTGPYAPFFWINGPIVKEVGVNRGRACLGPGSQNRANVAIGRSIRLILMNIAGAYAGVNDLDTIGSANKFSMVVGENEAKNPWEPYHVEKGFSPEESTVTALNIVSHIEVQDLDSNSPEGFLTTYVNTICAMGSGSGIQGTPMSDDPEDQAFLATMGPTKYGHEPVLLIPPSVAQKFKEDGWEKDDIRAYLFKHARIPKRNWLQFSRYRGGENMAQKWKDAPPDTGIPIVFFPEAFRIIVVGGPANKMSYCPVGGRSAAATRSVDKWR
jgi:hypothetical protein